MGPPDINQSFFKETKRSHRGVIIEYTYTVDDKLFIFEMYQLFEQIHNPLSQLLRESINFFHGITVTYRQFTALYNKKEGVEEDKYLGTSAALDNDEKLANISQVYEARIAGLDAQLVAIKYKSDLIYQNQGTYELEAIQKLIQSENDGMTAFMVLKTANDALETQLSEFNAKDTTIGTLNSELKYVKSALMQCKICNLLKSFFKGATESEGF